jgi:hypothetical protein
MHNNSKSKKGFTLVELSLAATVTVILFSLIMTVLVDGLQRSKYVADQVNIYSEISELRGIMSYDVGLATSIEVSPSGKVLTLSGAYFFTAPVADNSTSVFAPPATIVEAVTGLDVAGEVVAANTYTIKYTYIPAQNNGYPSQVVREGPWFNLSTRDYEPVAVGVKSPVASYALGLESKVDSLGGEVPFFTALRNFAVPASRDVVNMVQVNARRLKYTPVPLRVGEVYPTNTVHEYLFDFVLLSRLVR